MNRHTTPLRELLIVGAGGSGREVAWLARDIYGEGIELTFAVEANYIDSSIVDDIQVKKLDSDLSTDALHYIVAVGDHKERKRLVTFCDSLGLLPATLVHPSVIQSSRVEIDAGAIVCAGSILTTNVRIGQHVHINVGCTVSHDVVIGDFATLSPGVHIAGHVEIGTCAFIGTGATIINGAPGRQLTVGYDAVVAAGSCVTKPVESGTMVAGVPAVRKH